MSLYMNAGITIAKRGRAISQYLGEIRRNENDDANSGTGLTYMISEWPLSLMDHMRWKFIP